MDGILANNAGRVRAGSWLASRVQFGSANMVHKVLGPIYFGSHRLGLAWELRCSVLYSKTLD